jgi:hypothetical protein
MVEKLWQSTLQKKGLHLTTTPTPISQHPHYSPASSIAFSRESSYGLMLEESNSGSYPVVIDDHDAHVLIGEMGMGEEEETEEDGWPSLESMAKMDSQTKLRWMMKMMVIPPCWTERKVRLFGAFGVMEEKVLQ